MAEFADWARDWAAAEAGGGGYAGTEPWSGSAWQVPYSSTAAPPPPPTGPKEGDTKTDEYGEWTFLNGQWVLTNPVAKRAPVPPVEKYQCPYCSLTLDSYAELTAHIAAAHPGEEQVTAEEAQVTEVTPSPLGEMGPTPDWGQVDYAVGSPEWWEMTGGARPGFLGALGLLGKESRNPWQQYMAGMFDPLQMMFGLASPMAMMGYPSMDPGTGMFSQWAPQYAEDPFAMYGMARSMLGNVMGMGTEQRGALGMGGGGGPFADLLGMGLRTALGPGASWLAGRVPKLQEQWLGKYPQSQGPNFIEYIKQKYNLGQWL